MCAPRHRLFVVLLAISLILTSCSPPSSGRASPPEPQASAAESTEETGAPPQVTPTPQAAAAEGWLTAKEAVAAAYEVLDAPWKANAKLAFVGRYSPYCKDCSPLIVEEDDGIGADGRQQHWVVIFADPASSATVLYVDDDEARVARDHVVAFSPEDMFDREGWVDSTAIQFEGNKRVGLTLRAGRFFEGADDELAKYPLLWLAETSFGHDDVYDAQTGEYITSR